MGGGKVKAPAPSAEERALQKAQADLLGEQRGILQQQQQYQQILLPVLAEQAGFDLEFDDQGNLLNVSQRADPLDALRTEIETLELERSRAALRGDLPVDPALERELSTQEETLRERLRSQFGPGYETSTPGIQTLDEFFRSAEGLRSDARTGQLTLAEQLSMARQSAGQGAQAQSLNILTGAAQGMPLQLFQAAGQLAGGFGQAQIPFLQNRQMQFNANMANAQLGAQSAAGWGKLAGMMFGTLMGGPAGGAVGGQVGGTAAGLF